MPTVSTAVFSETVDALAQTFARGDYQLLLGQTAYRGGGEDRLVDAFLGRRVEGLVLTGKAQSTVHRRVNRAYVSLNAKQLQKQPN